MDHGLMFMDFYKDIRQHFSTNVEHFQEFKSKKSVIEKIRYLLSQDVVLVNIKLLEECFKNYQNVEKNANTKSEGQRKNRINECSLNSKNKLLPFLTKKSKLSYSKKKGRMLVATQKILPGEIVIREPAYCSSTFPSFCLIRCMTCFKQVIDESKVSCSNCNDVVFCSEECSSDPEMIHLHHYECGLLPYLQDDNIGPMTLLAFRAVVKAGYQNCYEMAHCDQNEKEMQKVARYDSQDYSSVFLQVDHQDDRDPGDTFRRSLTALYLIKFLHIRGYFPQEENTNQPFYNVDNQSLVTICKLLVKHMQSCACNAYEISELIITPTSGPIHAQRIGGAIYPTVSLANHSCYPNTTRYNNGDICLFMAVRTINVGEEITDSYGFHYQTNDLDERQNSLEKHYFFKCDCRACKEDWSLMSDLRNFKTIWACASCGWEINTSKKKCEKCRREIKLNRLFRIWENLDENIRNNLSTLNRKNRQSILEKYMNLFRDVEKWIKPPSYKLVMCEQVIAMCFFIEGNIIEKQDDI